jgi:DNA transposition AAA+ family ATPase
MPDEPLDPIPMFPSSDAGGAAPQDNADADRRLMDRLNEQNRILLEARMLPRGKTLTEEHVAGVREAFADYIAKRDIMPSQVAREIGYSPAVVSDWSKGKYKGDVDKVTHAINDWMERDARREKASRPKDYVETRVAEMIQTAVYLADKETKMVAIVTPSGSGKTKVLKILTERMRGIYAYVDPNITERELVFKIASALGFPRTGKSPSKAALRHFIIEKLADTRRPIFLDEAQNLHKAIGVVRSLFDQANVPIVMAGTREIMTYVDDRSDGRGQFSRRCIRFNIIEQIINVEGPGGGAAGGAGRHLFDEKEIERFLKSKEIRVTRDGLHMMWLLACLANHGTLGLIETLGGIAQHLNPKAEAIDREMVVEAMQMFRGPQDAAYLEKLADRYEQIAKVG